MVGETKDRFHRMIVEERHDTSELLRLFGYINVRDYILNIVDLDIAENPKYTYYYEEVQDACVIILSELKIMYPLDTMPEKWI